MHTLTKTEPDDGELLESWKRQHCGPAFETLVRRHMGMVHGVALRRTGEPGIADDVTQTVFSLLARKAARLKPGPLAPWLHRAAVMEAAKVLRTESRHRRKLHEYALHCETSRPDSQGESGAALLPRLDAAIAALPERFRNILVLRFYEGLSFREIAGRTGESEAAAQRRGHRALGRLEKSLRMACGAALAGVTQAATATSCTLAPAAVAARASAAVPALTGFNALIHTMHPATLMASTAAVTAFILGIPLTLQMQRTGAAERRLTEVLAARSPVPVTATPIKNTNPATDNAGATIASVAIPAPSGSDAEAARRRDARDYAVKAAAEEESKIMNRLRERFQFTPEQDKAIAAHHAQIRALREKFAEKRRLREPFDPAFFALEYGFHPDIPPHLQSLLTSDQQQNYQKWEQERRTNYIEGWSGSELSFLADPLELTAEQKDQVYARLHGVWSAYSKEDLSVLTTAESIVTRMDTNHQTRADALVGVLTPEQFPQWEKTSLDWNREFVKRYQDPSPNRERESTTGH